MDIIQIIGAIIPLKLVLGVLAVGALVSAVQVFLEQLAKILDKDPNSESAFERLVAKSGKIVLQMKKIVDFLSANRPH